jgi:ketol-acid reductoisomerase
MKNALKRIQNGEYAKMFITEGAMNYPSMTAYRRNNAVANENGSGQTESRLETERHVVRPFIA